LNISKELIVDFSRKQQRGFHPLFISGSEVERMDTFEYLGVTISQDLSWILHISTTVKKARQRLYLFRQLTDSKLLFNCTRQDFLAF